MMEMTTEQAQELAELYPLVECKCGAVTLGGSDVVTIDGKTTFPEHAHKKETVANFLTTNERK